MPSFKHLAHKQNVLPKMASENQEGIQNDYSLPDHCEEVGGGEVLNISGEVITRNFIL